MRRGSMADQLREAVAGAPSVQNAMQAEESASNSVQGVAEESTTEAETEAAEQSTAEENRQSAEEQSADNVQEIEYFNDLPGVLGIDAEDFYKLKLKLRDDEKPVAWGEIKERLQEAKTGAEELARQRAEFDQEVANFRQQAGGIAQAQQQQTERVQKAQGQLQRLGVLYQAKEQEWETRKQMEPGAVANERQELMVAAAAAQQELQAAQAEQAQQQQAFRQEYLMKQHNAIVAKIPDWQDPVKRQALDQQMAEFATRYDVPVQEYAQITDARTKLLIHDAMEGAKLRESAKETVAKIKAVPQKTSKGVRVKGGINQSNQQVAESVAKARANRSRRTITDAVRAVVSDAMTNR